MKTHITHDGTIETDYDDLDIERTHPEPNTQTTGNPAHSAAIMKAFRRAKKAGAVNDIRSRKIVAALQLEREKKHPAKKVSPRSKRTQKMLGDF